MKRLERSKLPIAIAIVTASICSESLYAQGAEQETDKVDDQIIEEEVVVKGYRRQAREAISQKLESTRIGDFLTQDELGRQPDLNVADSLRRAPGVVTVFDEDEGRYVGLRGLDETYTFVSIDGSLIGSTDRDGREINIESIPPTAVKRLEIIKSITPDLDAQSVGGVVNLVTRSAFDSDGLYAVVNSQFGFHSNTDDIDGSFGDPSPRVDFAVSNTFADETVGFLLSGTYFDKNRDQERPILGLGFVNDNPVATIGEFPVDYTNRITRWNVLGKFEYRPTEDFYTYLTVSHFDYQYNEERVQFRGLPDNDTLVDQTASTGQFTQGRGFLRFDRFPLGQEVDNIQWHASFKPTEVGKLEATVSWSNAFQGHPFPNAVFETSVQDAFGYSYDFGTNDADGESITSTVLNDPSALSDLSQFAFTRYVDGRFDNEEDVVEFKLDYGHNVEGETEGFGFKVGAKYRNLEKRRFETSEVFTLVPGASLTLADGLVSGVRDFPYLDIDYPFLNPDLFDAYFDENRSDFELTGGGPNFGANYNVQEDVSALYGMVTYHSGPHKLLGGLRYEHTEVATIANQNVDGNNQPIARTVSYEHVLPSVVYTYDLNDQMKLRAGYSQAIGRPNHPDLAGAESIDTTSAIPTFNRANPDLQPRESDSFDLAFDYNIDDGQFFSAAFFHKTVDNQISDRNSNIDIDGTIFLVTQAENLEEVTLTGLEFSYIDDSLDFLPGALSGLGIATNLTLLDGENFVGEGAARRDVGNVINQPDYILNASLLYAYGPFSSKLTYNYVDDRLRSFGSTSRDDNYEVGYEQLDLQLRWQVSEKMQVSLEGRNIFEDPRTFRRGDILTEINDFGNSWWLGASYKY